MAGLPTFEELQAKLRELDEEEERRRRRRRPWWDIDLGDVGRSAVSGLGRAAESVVGAAELGHELPLPGLNAETRDIARRGFERIRSPIERFTQEQAPEEQATFTGEGKRPIQALLQGVAGAAPQLAGTVAATALGGPIAGAAVGGGMVAGGSFDEKRDRGVDPRTAALVGAGEGLLAAPLEALGGKAVLAGMRGAGRGATGLRRITPGLTEAATELPQEALSAGLEVATGRSLEPGELRERLVAAPLTGFALGEGAARIGRGLAPGREDIPVYQQRQQRNDALLAEGEITPDEHAQASRENEEFYKRAKDPDQVGVPSLSERALDLFDRAYDANFNAEEAPVRSVLRALHPKKGGADRRAEAVMAIEESQRIDDYIRLGRSSHGVATSPLLYSTKVLAEDSGPLREAHGKIQAMMEAQAADLEAGGDVAGATDRRRSAAEWQLPDAAQGNWIKTGESLADILHGLDSEQTQDLEHFMAWRRQIELAERAADGADINVNPVNTARAREFTSMLKQKNSEIDIEQLAQRTSNWARRAQLDALLTAGRISTDAYVRMFDANRRYVPFFRVDQASSSATGPDVRVSKKAKAPVLKVIEEDFTTDAINEAGEIDSKKIGANPLEQMIARTLAIQKYATKQRVRNHLGDIFDQLGEDFDGEIRRLPEGEKQTAETFEAWKDGERIVYEAPSDVTRVLENLGSNELETVVKVAAPAAKMLRAGATLGLDFMFRNALRDPQSAWIYDTSIMPLDAAIRGDKQAAKKSLADAVKSPLWPIMQTVAGAADVFTHGRWSAEAIADGVADSVLVAADRPDAQAMLADVMAAPTAKGAKGLAQNVKAAHQRHAREAEHVTPGFQGMHKWLRGPMQTMSGTLELATRTAVYKRNKEAGSSDLEAMRNARESSLDFSRAGIVGRQLNGLQAFYNAEMQDVDKFARAMKSRPMATTAKAMAMITLPSVANWATWHDDEDYRALPEWRKMAFYTIGKRGDPERPWYDVPGMVVDLIDEDEKGFIHIPRPLGTVNLLFGYMTEKFLDYAIDKDPTAGRRVAEALQDQTPLRRVQALYNPTVEGAFATMAENLPTMFAGPIEAGVNQDMTFNRGKSIVPQALERSADPDEYFEYTPEIWKRAGAATGSSPIKMQHIFESYTATLGKQAAALSDVAYRASGAVGPRDARPMTAKDIPLVGGFLSREPIGTHSEPVRRFYELAGEYDEAKVSARKKHDLSTPAGRYLARTEFPILGESRIEDGNKFLREIRKRKKEARARRDWDELKRLDREMTRRITEFLPDSEWR